MWVLVGVIMTSTMPNIGCPYPTQFPVEEEINYPPVVNKELTHPYIYADPIFELDPYNPPDPYKIFIAVDDLNRTDDLTIRVIKNLHVTMQSGEPHQFLVTDATISSASIVSDASTLREAEITFQSYPCPAGSAPSTVILDVCITDRGFKGFTPNNDPCVPTEGNPELNQQPGYLDRYHIVLQCIEET